MKLDRRGFLAASAATTASLACGGVSRVPANERIVVGLIGTGRYARWWMANLFAQPDVEIVAIAEVEQQRRERVRGLIDDQYGAGACAAYVDYRELLARDDIDAVAIGTPDHWHVDQVVDACAAGKDVHCEKPLSLTIGEGREMVEAVARHDRVLQTGSHNRHTNEFVQAASLVRSGAIGAIERVVAGVPGPSRPIDLPEQPTPPSVAWDLWLGPAPARGYHETLCPVGTIEDTAWRGFREYSGGGMTDLGSHLLDIVQWALDADEGGPVEIRPPRGDDPLTWVYASGVRVEHDPSLLGLRFVGSEGTIWVTWGELTITPDRPLDPIEHATDDTPRLRHVRDWLDAIRSRTNPKCPAEIGHRSATVCHLGNLAYWLDRALTWDPVAERFVGDADADEWLVRPRRLF